ncbi:MAG: hypothetical protein JWP48_2432 [Actinoallomurus sp.]|jgi:hypothetical protein|nr:hypothetical protein [Actinoallomurus sp.]
MPGINPIRELLIGHVEPARADEHGFACAELVSEAVEQRLEDYLFPLCRTGQLEAELEWIS